MFDLTDPLKGIAAKIDAGRRITPDEALALAEQAPLALLGLLAMKALDTYQTPEGMPALKGILGAAACFLAAALLHCDYDVLGLALILALYKTREDKRAQCIAGAVFSLFEPVAPLAFGLVWFYSGERGSSSKLEQWAFYWFYPAHIFVLGILTNLLLFR